MNTDKTKKVWAYVGLGAAVLTLLSMFLGAHFNQFPIMPLSQNLGLALAILFLVIASASATVVNTIAWYERKLKAKTSEGK